jgi:hypothetical protein
VKTMKVLSLVLLILGLIASGFLAISLILGAGPFLLGMSYCAYVHSLVLENKEKSALTREELQKIWDKAANMPGDAVKNMADLMGLPEKKNK